MRIAVVTETWTPSVDGVVTRLENTVRELHEAGHEVLVVAPSAGTTIPGVLERRTRTLRLGFLYGGRPWALPDRVVKRSLREFKPDVVHVVNPILMGAAAVRWAAARYPVVVSYHTDVAAYASHYYLGGIRWLIHQVMRGSYRRAHARLATSDVGREHLAALGIDDVVLWGRGVDGKLFRPGRDGGHMRRALTSDADIPLALYVGRLASEKGCRRLVPLATGSPPVHLAFVGDGPDRRHLERALGGARATFAGTLHGDELADAYAAADVLLFPSETDTLGLVLLEAMACGLPIVAADTPTARQTLRQYPQSLLVAPDAPESGWNEAVHAVLRNQKTAAATSEGSEAPRTEGSEPVTGDWAGATAGLLGVYAAAQSHAAQASAATAVVARR